MKNNKRNFPLSALLFCIPFVIIVLLAILSVSKEGCALKISDKEKQEEHTQIVTPDDGDDGKSGENEGETEPPVVPDEPIVPPVPVKEYKNISFAAAGDILVHTNVYKYASQLAAGTDAEYDFKPMFRNIKDIISSADLAFVNQETPSAGKERGYSGYPTFNTPDEIADAVLDTGFDIVSIANNHMLDKGSTGYARNIDFWNSKGVLLLGGFKNREDYNTIRVLEHDGVKIAFLSYTYGTNGINLPAGSELVIPLENYDEIDRQTKEARAMADVDIVSMHWGHEDWFKPSDNQKNLARLMADNGVDVIIGHHSHTLQPIEWLDRPDGKKTLCAYSLGNLISTMMYSRNMLGAILTFDINETDDGFVIENPEMIPYMNYYKSGFSEPTLYLYKDFTDEMLNSHGCRKYDGYISRNYLNKIITDTIDKQFIKDEYCLSLYPADAPAAEVAA